MYAPEIPPDDGGGNTKPGESMPQSKSEGNSGIKMPGCNAETMTFGASVPEAVPEKDMWVPTESMQKAGIWRGYLKNVDADWEKFVAAVVEDDEDSGRAEASVIAAGFGVFLTSPRRGGKLWEKALEDREKSKAKGVDGAEFGVVERPMDWVRDKEDEEGDGMRMGSDVGELLIEVLRFERPVEESEGYVGFKKCEREVVAFSKRVQGLEGRSKLIMAECLCMEVVSPLLYLIVEAVETGEETIKIGAQRLLRFVAEEANAREVHVMVKVALGRVSESFIGTVTGMLVDDLVTVWATVVPRVVGKRSLFLRDVVEVLDRVVFMSDGDIIKRRKEDKAKRGKKKGDAEAEKDDDDDVGSAHEGFRGGDRPSKRERALFKFVKDLASVQKAQVAALAEDRAERGVVQGQDDPKVVPSILHNPPPYHKKAKEQMKELRKVIETQEGLVHDFETERGATLALLFKLVVQVVQRLPPPVEKESSGERSARAGPLLKFLDESIPLFEEFGIENAIDTCQQAQKMIGMKPLADEDAEVAEIALPMLRRNRRPEMLFGIDAVSSYLLVSLRLARGNLLSGDGIKTSAGFDLLSPQYAFDLMISFIMHLISHHSAAVAIAGIRLLSGMIADIPDGSLDGMMAILRTPHACTVAQTDCSWFGVASVLTKAVSRFDDPLLRTFAYQTFQNVLQKMPPPARFDVLEVLLLDTSHHVMAAQLIMELKNVLPVLDVDCPLDVSMERYTRFVEHVVPRYLLPRQEFLAGLHPATAVCSAAYFIVLRDCARLKREGDLSVEVVYATFETSILSRLALLRDYLDLGRKALEATASVIQIDLRKSKLDVNYKVADKPVMLEASGKAERDLNLVGAALAAVEPALDALREVLTAD